MTQERWSSGSALLGGHDSILLRRGHPSSSGWKRVGVRTTGHGVFKRMAMTCA